MEFESGVQWFFTNVILALIPIFINFLLMMMGVVSVTIQWYKVLKDGELFIFSTTISAASIGTLPFQESQSGLFFPITFWALIIILVISTALFAISGYFKLNEINMPNEKLFSSSSIVCAILASTLSFFVIA